MRWPTSGSADDEREPVFSVCVDGDPSVFALTGELDLDTAKTLEEVPILPETGETVVLDLAGLDFVDSSGLRSLVQVRRQVIDRGAHLVLRQPRANVRRVLEVSGLDAVFTVED